MKLATLILGLFIIASFESIAQPFSKQSQWENYFKSKIQNLDPIEGVWSNSYTIEISAPIENGDYSNYYPQAGTSAIYKEDNKYKVYYFGENADNSICEISFINTALEGIYLMNSYYEKSYSTARSNAVLTDNGLLEFSYIVPTEETELEVNIEGLRVNYEHQWIKMFPSKTDFEKTLPTSGTGFGISSNGIIVTNYHVVEGATVIRVRGVNSDFNKAFKAKILVLDKNNDLALIKIDDYSFTSLGTIPYIIKTSLASVGMNVFVLGYPLRTTMGDEVKLTNGIISSKTGFQGDITTYQISAPVQPGNSGGPLFDNQGNLIGIINAKHTGAENASYAVKSSYLMNLIELLSSPPKLQTVNFLISKSLTTQVEMVKSFVYIIEKE